MDLGAVRLDEICGPLLNNTYDVARRKALLHTLPFPAFQLEDSKKAPWLVRNEDLADYIAERAYTAGEAWKRSQL